MAEIPKFAAPSMLKTIEQLRGENAAMSRILDRMPVVPDETAAALVSDAGHHGIAIAIIDENGAMNRAWNAESAGSNPAALTNLQRRWQR